MSLKVSGTQIVDASGKPFRLRGTFTGYNERAYGLASTPYAWVGASSVEDSWLNESDFQRWKSAGLNCIEFQGFMQGELLTPSKTPNVAYFTDWMDKYANLAQTYQIYTIIDMSGLFLWDYSNRNGAMGYGFPDWIWEGNYSDPMVIGDIATSQYNYWLIYKDWLDLRVTKQDENRTAFVNLWTFMADRYKNNPYILWSPINEPTLWNPTINGYYNCPPEIGQGYSTFMTRIYDAIRATGNQQLVFINRPFFYNTTTWQLQMFPIDRDIVWEDHSYIASYRPLLADWKITIDNMVQMYHNGTSLPYPMPSMPPEWTAFTPSHPKPIFIGEYGIDPPSLIRSWYAIGNTYGYPDWKTILTEMVSYLDGKPLIGRQFYSQGWFYWKFENGWDHYEEIHHPKENYDLTDPTTYAGAYLTQAESDWLKPVVLGAPTEVALPFLDNFADISKWQQISGTWTA